jgi:hypothetical protein
MRFTGRQFLGAGPRQRLAGLFAALTFINIVVLFLWLADIRAPWQAPLKVLALRQAESQGAKIEHPWRAVAVAPSPPPTPKVVANAPPDRPPSRRLAVPPSSPVAVDTPSTQVAAATNLTTPNPPPELECRLWTPPTPEEAPRVQQALAAWKGNVQTRQISEVIGYVVYLPAAQARNPRILSELKEKGITDLFLLQSPPVLKGGISLGMYRSQESARQQQLNLSKKGIANIQVAGRPGTPKTVFRLTGTEAQMASLREINEKTRRGSLRTCIPAITADP